MLSHLRIKDFAIIDDVEIQFGDGFTVITGETGAGKSILIEAITLLLGSRGDTDFIRNKSDELVVEGIFVNNKEEILIKRTLNTSGRSRVYINGELSTLNQLKEYTAFMVDISGQHQHQMLLNEDFHIEIVDKFASEEELLIEYKKLREEYLSLLSEIERLQNIAREKDSRLDFLRFQRQEFAELAITKEEYEELLQESNIVKNGAKFQQMLSEAESILCSRDDSILNLFGRLKKRVLELSTMSKEFEPYLRELDGISAVLSEMEKLILDKLKNTDFSQERLDLVEGRLHRVKRLCEKYKISVEEIIPKLKRIDSEINELENSDITTKDLQKRLESVFLKLRDKAERLHKIRVKASDEISSKCEEILQRLGFKDAKIKFDIQFRPPSVVTDKEKVLENGFDSVKILFAPNLGEEFRPLTKIASGGELSRVMLAFKSAVAGKDIVGTYIFDEVDAGIGGAVAESVGRFLKELSKNRQVICITHLPQIASLGDEHFTVEKRVKNKRTTINIRKIQGEERVEEIARMLGGHEITEKNRAYARELLEKNS